MAGSPSSHDWDRTIVRSRSLSVKTLTVYLVPSANHNTLDREEDAGIVEAHV